MKEITKKIKSYSVLSDEAQEPVMRERPEALTGKTYKLKLPEYAMYVTINDLNGKPYEIFIRSKNVDHMQWIDALTRIVSAIFRNGGDIAFVARDLKEIHDGLGGRLKKGGGRHNSIVAEIGGIIEEHMGIVKEVSEYVAAKRLETKYQVCPKCQQHSAVLMDGCLTCVLTEGCNHSKCG